MEKTILERAENIIEREKGRAEGIMKDYHALGLRPLGFPSST